MQADDRTGATAALRHCPGLARGVVVERIAAWLRDPARWSLVEHLAAELVRRSGAIRRGEIAGDELVRVAFGAELPAVLAGARGRDLRALFPPRTIVAQG